MYRKWTQILGKKVQKQFTVGGRYNYNIEQEWRWSPCGSCSAQSSPAAQTAIYRDARSIHHFALL
jgi:hypothetical protein